MLALESMSLYLLRFAIASQAIVVKEDSMNKTKSWHVAAAAVALTTVFLFPGQGKGEIRSRSKGMIVMEPKDLPAQAKVPGSSMFLYSNHRGATYLFVEQEKGNQLSIFDVTDPAKIKLAGSATLNSPGEFQMVRPLNSHAILVRFENSEGILDLRRPSSPHLMPAQAAAAADEEDAPGGIDYVSETRMAPHDYQVFDLNAKTPAVLLTVMAVHSKVVNQDTGTTYLLGSDGLTVVRSMSVENEHKIAVLQARGN